MTALVLTLLIVSAPAGPPTGERYPEASALFQCNFDEAWDKNFDAWPDQWTRRRGRGFPQYVKVQIVSEASPAGPRCLRMDLDGAGAVAYSPVISVSPLHSFVLEGLLSTEHLRTSRAWLSLTLLDERRQRLETFTTERVQETRGWRRVRVGPISPTSEEVRLAIIGLHLEPGPQVELKGTARFADVWLGRLPRMSLSANSPHRLYNVGSPVVVTCQASGFSEKDPPLVFSLEDAMGSTLVKQPQRLKTREVRRKILGGVSAELAGLAGEAEWKPPIPGPGFYRVRVSIGGREELIHRRELTLAVIEPVAPAGGSEFGWSLPQGDQPLPLPLLAQIVVQAGVGRVKLPLWFDQSTADAQLDRAVAFNERMAANGIEVVGLLHRLPAELRRHFDDSLSPTAADIFTANPKVWYPSLEPILIRLAGQVRTWQLGDDKDLSFVGFPNVPLRLAEIKAQMDKAAHDTAIGVPWGWMSQTPEAPKPAWRFLSLTADPPLTGRELGAYLDGTRRAGAARWVLLEPLPHGQYSTEVRVGDLLRQIMACKVHGAEAVWASDPFNSQRGLMNDDGTPGELFLPWRTAATMLSGATCLGSIGLPNDSTNLVFTRGTQTILVVWNRQPLEESLYLGEEVRQMDVWGRASTPLTRDGRQRLEVGPLPLFVSGLHPSIARWRMELALESDRIPSVFGLRNKNALKIRNPFPRGVSGTADLVAPDVWSVTPQQVRFRLGAGETVQQPFEVTLPYDARSGRQPLRIDFEVQGDRIYRFSVFRHIDVGLRDVYVELTTRLNSQNELEVEQRFVNETDKTVSFRCELFAPDRQRQMTQVAGLGTGRDVKFYRLPDGAALIGKTLWLRAEEIGGPRVLNYRFPAER